MTALVVYVLLVAVFQTIVFVVGVMLDTVVPAGWNVIVAMLMFFAVLAVMWPVAVYITERWLMSEPSAKGAKSAR
jgi:hypothetical protein